MFRIDGRNALIFGGGSTDGSITNGLAAAIVYAKAGGNVAIFDVNEAAVQSAVEKAKEACTGVQGAGRIIGLQGDATDEESVRSAVEKTRREFGTVDIAHNNIGIAHMGAPDEMNPTEWELVMRVNLTTAYLSTRATLPHMIEQQYGRFVNIASAAGLRHIGYNYPSYAASKAALIAFTRDIAVQHAAAGIRANSIAPGLIDSPMIYRQIAGSYSSAEEMQAARARLSPTGTMGDPYDVAHAALFLVSDEASYVNGICLAVDGGLTVRSVPLGAA